MIHNQFNVILIYTYVRFYKEKYKWQLQLHKEPDPVQFLTLSL